MDIPVFVGVPPDALAGALPSPATRPIVPEFGARKNTRLS
jgi:hypothetical protein